MTWGTAGCLRESRVIVKVRSIRKAWINALKNQDERLTGLDLRQSQAVGGGANIDVSMINGGLFQNFRNYEAKPTLYAKKESGSGARGPGRTRWVRVDQHLSLSKWLIAR